MNIEVGEYVRTIDGYIRKIIETNTIFYKYVLDFPYKNSVAVAEKKIIKHSKNIIDLIELKDIVEIHNLVGEDISFTFEIFNEETMADFLKGIKDKEIKLISILTKEQCENNCYRLE